MSELGRVAWNTVATTPVLLRTVGGDVGASLGSGSGGVEHRTISGGKGGSGGAKQLKQFNKPQHRVSVDELFEDEHAEFSKMYAIREAHGGFGARNRDPPFMCGSNLV